MLDVTAVVSAGTGVLLTVWAAFYFAFARSVDVEGIRTRMIENIQGQHRQLLIKEFIDVIYDADFRLLQKKEKNVYFIVTFGLVILANILMFVLSLIQGVVFFQTGFEDRVRVVFDMLVLLYCLALIFTVFFLYFEIMYYVKLDEHKRSLPKSGTP